MGAAARADAAHRRVDVGARYGLRRTVSSCVVPADPDEVGWTEGTNLQIDYQWGAFDLARGQASVGELQQFAPEVILAEGTQAITPLIQANVSVPIVFVLVSEPVAQGFVQSLANPGGNITGFSNLEPTMGGKWLELLKEVAPRVTRVAILFHLDNARAVSLYSPSVAAGAQRLAMDILEAPVREVADIDEVIRNLAREPNSGLVLPPDPLTNTHRKLIVDLAARHGLPAIYSRRFFAHEGGLISYGNDSLDQFRQAAEYIDRILRGAKPADLPVQQPIKFELVINMKTAKALNLTVPLTLQVAADEVIE
jgi:putative ABC transport system substrate-binding protein